jgi:hypothetical protein
MPSHDTYNKTTITTIKISLRTTGEAMKLKKRFQAGRLSFAFRPGLDLDLVLALDTELYFQLVCFLCFFPTSTTTGIMIGRR